MKTTFYNYLKVFGLIAFLFIGSIFKSYTQCKIYSVNFYAQPMMSCDNFQFSEDCDIDDISTTKTWDMGDGNITDTMPYSFQYTYAPGTYNVKLTVVDVNDSLCYVSKTKTITVAPVTANFTYEVNNNFVDFTANANGGGSGEYDISWNFNVLAKGKGDSKSGDPTVSHMYTDTGKYAVMVTVQDRNNWYCSASYMDTVYITQINPCSIDAKFTKYTMSCDQYEFNADVCAVDPVTLYWDLGDGTFDDSTGFVMHNYNQGAYKVKLTAVSDSDTTCTATYSDSIFYIPITAYFTKHINKNYVTFNSYITGGSGDYYIDWDLGEGMVFDFRNVYHKYTYQDTFPISLYVGDKKYNSCNAQYLDTVIISEIDTCDIVYASFIVGDIDSTGHQVRFINNSSGNTDSYWDFGDGNFGFGKYPVHYFIKSRMYNVCLYVSDSVTGCEKSKCESIQIGNSINESCAASFMYYIDSADANTVHFADNSIGNPDSWCWDFGDGSMSSNYNPVYTYPSPGYYTVKLNTYNSNTQCMDNYRKTILVGNDDSSTVRNCKADFMFISDSSSTDVQFYNQSLGNNLTKFAWDFGDNTFDTINQNPPTHTYADAGYYNVCLKVFEFNGGDTCRSIICKDVKVGNDIASCLSKFTFIVDSSSKTVTFYDASEGNPNSWSWDFEDGSTSTSQNPSHIYTNAGYYIIALRIETAGGCISESVNVVNVSSGNNGLKAKFIYHQEEADVKASSYPVEFKGAAFGDPAMVAWDFDDTTGGQQTNSSTLSPVYEYNALGTYHVCLAVFDPVAQQNAIECKNVNVTEAGVETLSGIIKTSLVSFPNPFSSYTNIVYSLPNSTNVDISIYDILGNKVNTFVNVEGSAGDHIITFNRSALNSGVYFLELRTSETIITKKLIVQ